MIRHQRLDGGFSYCCEVNPLPDALMIIFFHCVGLGDDPLISELCARLQAEQNPDGSWYAFEDQKETLSGSTLAYFALLLSGHDKSQPHMERVRKMIQRQGGITNVSNLTKIILATTGQLTWSALPQGHIEVILWDKSAPVNMFDFAGFARLHLVPYMVLSHLQFQYPIPRDLGLEDLNQSSISLPTLHIPHLNLEALKRCHAFLLERLEPNGTLASYLTATVFAVFAMQAMGYDRDHPRIQRAIRGLKSMVYRRNGSVHQQLFTSTVWDTALCMRALRASKLPSCRESLRRGAVYLLHRQQHRSSDWAVHNPSAKAGGWGFSDVNTRYPDVDDTVAALLALLPYRRGLRNEWERAAQWVLSMQNRDGGWSAFDKNCNKAWLEWLPINDMGQAMTDPSSADLTGRVLESIAITRIHAPEQVARGVRWLLRRQKRNGSWFGRWGIAYIYGTWAAVRGLQASRVPKDSDALKRALAWLENIQNEDGGFGESCRSDVEGKYVALHHSTPSQTAWALMAMMGASSSPTGGMERAVEYLMKTARSSGGWRESYPTGAGVVGQAYLRYHSYPNVWPLLALSEYKRLTEVNG
jgi:sporulenol synthase